MVLPSGLVEKKERGDKVNVGVGRHADLFAEGGWDAIENDGIKDDESDQGNVLVDLNDGSRHLKLDVFFAITFGKETTEHEDDVFVGDPDDQLLVRLVEQEVSHPIARNDSSGMDGDMNRDGGDGQRCWDGGKGTENATIDEPARRAMEKEEADHGEYADAEENVPGRSGGEQIGNMEAQAIGDGNEEVNGHEQGADNEIERKTKPQENVRG